MALEGVTSHSLVGEFFFPDWLLKASIVNPSVPIDLIVPPGSRSKQRAAARVWFADRGQRQAASVPGKPSQTATNAESTNTDHRVDMRAPPGTLRL